MSLGINFKNSARKVLDYLRWGTKLYYSAEEPCPDRLGGSPNLGRV